MLDALRSALGFILGDGEEPVVEDWATSEDAFEHHFGIEYDVFAEIVSNLDQAQHDLYAKTLKVNAEAAVTWLLYEVGG